MNLLRNGLLMRKTGDRLRTELTEIFAFLCGSPAEFITRSRIHKQHIISYDRPIDLNFGDRRHALPLEFRIDFKRSWAGSPGDQTPTLSAHSIVTTP